MFPGSQPAKRLIGIVLLALYGAFIPSAHAQEDRDETTRSVVAARLAPVSYATVPLNSAPLGPWRRIQLTARQMNDAILTLDPNRFEWNGYSPNWVSTRMAPVFVPVTLRAVTGLPPRKAGAAKVYEIRAKDLPRGTRFHELGLGDRLRLVSAEAGQPLRLLSLNEKGEIQRVISLEKEGANAVPPMGIFTDAFSLESAVLTMPLDGASQVSIQGSLNAGTAKLVLDRNAKTLDAYGDPDVSTLMAPLPREVRLVEKKDVGGEAGKTVRVFDIEGLPETLTTKFRLVVAKNFAGNNRLLVVNPAGQALRVIPLEAVVPVAGPLIGTQWQLEKMGYNNRTLEPGTDQVYKITFLPGGRLGGIAEKNRVVGTYAVADNSLSVSPLASTRVANSPGSIAPAFIKALKEVTSYTVRDNKLILRLKSSAGTMVFAPQPE